MPETPTIHLRLRRRVTVPPGEPIRLGQVSQMIAPPELEQKLRELVLYRPAERDGNIVLIDMIRIVRLIKEAAPEASIEQFGEPHVLVDVYTEEKPLGIIPFALVWVLLFIGSGLAIMNFHADVSMPEVHRRITELLTGVRIEHPYMLQIPYSIGIGLGMVLFFNHLFKKKFNEEPSPLEVELFSYQESMNQYLVAEEYRKLYERKDGEA